ncbi:TadE family type IV pilus minor pilin [Saxibacter everestensis]|uniref:TadE family type IV pilus minor pilin n=1 Tax=Saxibacter everestensis TaxID=2909229 RepID=A0ABY8QQ02_9MICO|nr:TadE family type IV pilus minor pilin [Brevibacteriaceae bacterium ZFBP1038]
MPAIVFVLLILLAAASLGLTQLKLSDASRAGAREAARGESAAAIVAAAKRVAGPAADVDIAMSADFVTVTVGAQLPSMLREFVGKPVEATATARREWKPAGPEAASVGGLR